MLTIHRSNRMERLLEELGEVLEKPLDPPLASEVLLVQSHGVETWVSTSLSKRFGVWANGKVRFARNLIEDLLQDILGKDGPDLSLFRSETLTWSILALLPELLGKPEFEPLSRYLEGDEHGRKAYALAGRIAQLFDEYAVFRPEMVTAWEKKRDERDTRDKRDTWQKILWRALVERAGPSHLAAASDLLLERIEDPDLRKGLLPERISVFGISTLPPLFVRILNAVARHAEVHWFLLTPSRERDGIRNPLLQGMGVLAAHFEKVLEENAPKATDSDASFEDPLDHGSRTLLKSIQSDILNNRKPPYPPKSGGKKHLAAPGGGAPKAWRGTSPQAGQEKEAITLDVEDRSITVHSCHSEMREVEVLRDQLLALFQKDANLRPEDILVMAPDLATYAPYIESVFGAETDPASRIPFSLADRSRVRERGVAEALLAVLRLGRSRLVVEEVLDLLSIGAVSSRFGLAPNEVETVSSWTLKAGVRWAADETHREATGQPRARENTWRFGLDRLLLGMAMPGRDEILWQGVLPLDSLEGQDALVLGKLASFVETLFGLLEEMKSPRDIPAWCSLLRRAVGRLTERTDETETGFRRVERALQELETRAADAGFKTEADLDVLRSHLEAELEGETTGRGDLAGGVTFASLLPMRTVPRRVVCLLGLSDQAFPRSRSVLEFDRMAQDPKPGDRSPRIDDRYLFLEALLSAGKRLLVTYVGQSIKDGSVIPPSTVVSDLLDAIDEGFVTADGKEKPSERIVVKHPLQPWSPRYFDQSDPRLFSYSNDLCLAASALASGGKKPGPFLRAPLPLDDAEVSVITLDELIRFFRNPAQYFLEHRLGVDLSEKLEAMPDREPVMLTKLEEYNINDLILGKALEVVDKDPKLETLAVYHALLKAQGRLPLGSAGEVHYGNLLSEVRRLATKVHAEAQGRKLEPVSMRVEMDMDAPELTSERRELTWARKRIRLEGRVDGIWQSGLLSFDPGKIKVKRLFRHWLRHLALLIAAPKEYPRQSTLIGRAEDPGKKDIVTIRFHPVEPGKGQAALETLVRLFLLGQVEPLRFFLDTSYKFARSRRKIEEEGRTVDPPSVKAAWASDYLPEEHRQKYEHEDASITKVFDHETVLHDESCGPGRSFQAVSWAVFQPMFESLKGGDHEDV